MERNIFKKSMSVFIVFVMLLGFNTFCPQEASACLEPNIGDIEMIAYGWAPQGWVFCWGQSLPVSQYQALYSLIGNTYGGNSTTFNVPDLRGRVPIGIGHGIGLANYSPGQTGGQEYVTLTTSQLPVGINGLQAVTTAATTSTPAVNVYPAIVTSTVTAPDRQEITINTNSYAPLSATPSQNIVIGAAITEGGQPHENRQPYLGINFIIATDGSYPIRP